MSVDDLNMYMCVYIEAEIAACSGVSLTYITFIFFKHKQAPDVIDIYSIDNSVNIDVNIDFDIFAKRANS